jgi:hypothetical protein
VISIKNDSTRNYSSVWIECGFFHGSELVASGRDSVYKLAIGSTGFVTVSTSTDEIAVDRAECRSSSTHSK